MHQTPQAPRQLTNAEQRTTLAIMVFERTKEPLADAPQEESVAKMRAAAAEAVCDELARLAQPETNLVAVAGVVPMARA